MDEEITDEAEPVAVLNTKIDYVKARDIERYMEYLRTYTNLAESSIRLYGRTLSNYFSRYNELSVQFMNEFISHSFRESRSNYVKYMFKHLLRWVEKDGWYKKLVKVKKRARIKSGNYYSVEIIIKIISNIKEEMLRDINNLQYALGNRCREIIKLKEEFIELNYKPDVIRLTLQGKGEKENISFLDISYKPILEKYMDGKPGYLFLPHECNMMDDALLEIKVSTMYQYAYRALKESAEELGYKIATHDFKRNVLEGIDNIQNANMVGRHSSFNLTMRYKNKANTAPIEMEQLKHQHEVMGNDKNNTQP